MEGGGWAEVDHANTQGCSMSVYGGRDSDRQGWGRRPRLGNSPALQDILQSQGHYMDLRSTTHAPDPGTLETS